MMSGLETREISPDVIARLQLLRSAGHLRFEWRAHRMEGSTLRRWTLNVLADGPTGVKGIEFDLGLTTVSGHGLHPQVRGAVELVAACLLLPARVGVPTVEGVEYPVGDRLRPIDAPKSTTPS